MAMNPLPPQAYTKETLSNAFAWLQSQSDSIKEMASNPDILVGLYLKAKLQGEDVLERPSIQNFKNELKSLAGMMGEFSLKTEPRKTELPKIDSQKLDSAPPPVATNSRYERMESHSLDPKSVQMIREVKEQFNLSSDAEALRFLISVGFQKIKKSL